MNVPVYDTCRRIFTCCDVSGGLNLSVSWHQWASTYCLRRTEANWRMASCSLWSTVNPARWTPNSESTMKLNILNTSIMFYTANSSTFLVLQWSSILQILLTFSVFHQQEHYVLLPEYAWLNCVRFTSFCRDVTFYIWENYTIVQQTNLTFVFPTYISVICRSCLSNKQLIRSPDKQYAAF